MVSRIAVLKAMFNRLVFSTILMILIDLILLSSVEDAVAHTPHDDIYSVAVSPDFRNDKTIFVLTRGAVLKSRNGGKSWYSVVNGLDNRYIPFAIDVSATDKETLYLATLGDGLYKSENGGESWTPISDGPGSEEIDLVAVSPHAKDIVFARDTRGQLFRSSDSGESWKEVTPKNAVISAFGFVSGKQDHLLVGTTDGAVFFSDKNGTSWHKLEGFAFKSVVTSVAAVMSGESDRHLLIGTSQGGVLRSTDGGDTFVTVFKAKTEQPVTSVAFSPHYSEDERVFALLWDEGVICSTDGGSTWNLYSSGLTRHRQSEKLGRPSFSKLLGVPSYRDDQTLFIGGFDGLFRSTNFGKDWTQIDTLSTTLLLGLGISPNYHNDQTVAVTSYLWGAYLSENGGVSWRSINLGVEDYARNQGLTRLFNISFSPAFESDRVMFTSTWYRLVKSGNGGRQWNQILPIDTNQWRGRHHGMVIALSPNFGHDGIAYIGTHRGQLLRSDDGGNRFNLLKEFDVEIGSLVLSPGFVSDGIVFVGLPGEIYKSSDGGRTWSKSGFELCSSTSSGTTVKRIADALPGRLGREMKKWGVQVETEDRRTCGVRLAISPAYTEDQTIFAGSAEGLYLSKNGGETWNPVQDPAIGPENFVEGVALSPNFADDRTLLASFRGKGLYKSVDGGQSFTAVGRELIAANRQIANPPCFPIPNSSPLKFSPAYFQDSTIFGYADSSLYKSQDGGETWEQLFSPSPSFKDRAYVHYRYQKQIVEKKTKRLLKDPKFLTGTVLLVAVGFTFGIISRKLKNRTTQGPDR